MADSNSQSGNGGVSVTVTSSPWSQIVRGGGGESEVVAIGDSAPIQEDISNDLPDWSPIKVVQEVVSSPDDSGSDNSGCSNASKKPVWNRMSNGVVEVVSPVMGTAWPALGESTKPTLRSSSSESSSESLKALSDGLLTPALQVTGSSSPSHKQASANNVNTSSTPNHVGQAARQKSMKRSGGNSSENVSANGVISQPPPTSQDFVVEASHIASGKQGNVTEQPSPRDHGHKESQKGLFGSQAHSGNDNHHQRGSYRRGNGGSYNHNYGGKRDNDRGNQEWNQHSRSFNNRDTNLQSQRGFSRGYMRPAVHTPTSFIPPPLPVPVQSFGNNMMYPDVTSPVIYVPGPHPSAMPFGAPLPPQLYFAGYDTLLHSKIVTQIDYYFSNENLVRDTYLRRNMDEQGWVSISLIAGFKKELLESLEMCVLEVEDKLKALDLRSGKNSKVSCLTDNVQLILHAMQTSTAVEVQGDKIRRRNDWMKWIMPAAVSSPQAGLLSQLQGLGMHEATSEGLTGHHSQEAGFQHTTGA